MIYFLETILFFVILTNILLHDNKIKSNIFIQSQFIFSGSLNIDIENFKYLNKNSKPSEFVLNHKKFYEDSIEANENDLIPKFSGLNVKEEHFKTRITNDEKTNLLNDQSGDSFFSRINLYNEKKEKMKVGQDYYLIYNSYSKMVSDFDYAKLNSLNIFDEKYYPIKCENTFNKFKFEQNVYELSKTLKIKKTDFFSFTNFMMDHEGILYLSTNHNKSKNPNLKNIVEEFEEEFKKGEIVLGEDGIKNFWISIIKRDKEDKKLNGILILLLKDEVSLVIFNMKTDDKKFFHFNLKFDTKLNFNSKMPGGTEFSLSLNITKAEVIENGNILIVATYENGLNIFKRNKESSSDIKNEFEYFKSITNFYNKQRNIIRILLIDFMVSDDIIYLLIENFGIKQYSLKTFKISNFEFYHPFINNLVRYNKIITTDEDFERKAQMALITYSDSKIFSFGATVNNKNKNVTEFYLEFVVEKSTRNNSDTDNENLKDIDENNSEEAGDLNLDQLNDKSNIKTIPVINKVYYSDRHVNFKNFYNDGIYTYMFDSKTKFLFLIPNSYNKFFPAVIFKFDFSNLFPYTSEKFTYKVSKLTYFETPGFILLKSNSKANDDSSNNSTSSNSNNLLFISDFFSTGSSLLCSFKKFGNFVFNLTSFENSISTSENAIALIFNKKTISVSVFNHKIYIWAIIGIVIGCLIILIILLFVLTRRRKIRTESQIMQIDTRRNSNNENNRDFENENDHVEMARKISENENMNCEKEIVIGFDEKFNVNEKYQI